MATLHEKETLLTGSIPRMDPVDGKTAIHNSTTLDWISNTLEALNVSDTSHSAPGSSTSKANNRSIGQMIGLFGTGVLVGIVAGSLLAKSR